MRQTSPTRHSALRSQARGGAQSWPEALCPPPSSTRVSSQAKSSPERQSPVEAQGPEHTLPRHRFWAQSPSPPQLSPTSAPPALGVRHSKMSSVADLTATQRSGELQSASELHWEGGRGRQILSVSLAPSVVEISVGSQMKLPSSEQSTGRSQGWAHWSSTQRFDAQSASALHASPSSPPSAASHVILMGEAERSTRQTSPWRSRHSRCSRSPARWCRPLNPQTSCLQKLYLRKSYLSWRCRPPHPGSR